MEEVQTIKELKEQIAEENKKIEREREREMLEVEKENLKSQLKNLRLTPADRRKRERITKFKTALKSSAKKGFQAVRKQAALIQARQRAEEDKMRERGIKPVRTSSGIVIGVKKGKNKSKDSGKQKVKERIIIREVVRPRSKAGRFVPAKKVKVTRQNYRAKPRSKSGQFVSTKKTKKRKTKKSSSRDVFGGIGGVGSMGLPQLDF